MRIGTLCSIHQNEKMYDLVASGFGFIELCETRHLGNLPDSFPEGPLIWQCPDDLPAEYIDDHIRAAVLHVWRDHLAAAQKIGVALMVVQFRRPETIVDKTAFIDHYIDLLTPITAEARAAAIQVVLRNSPDNRDQLKLLREIVPRVHGLGIALDIAYAHHRVVKNLATEYLWDSDLGVRIAHIYISDTNGQDSSLRLPLNCLGNAGIEWAKLVHELRQRYNASITIDVGQASMEYLMFSRSQWLSWWQAGSTTP